MRKAMKQNLIALSMILILTSNSYLVRQNVAVLPEKEPSTFRKKLVYINKQK